MAFFIKKLGLLLTQVVNTKKYMRLKTSYDNILRQMISGKHFLFQSSRFGVFNGKFVEIRDKKDKTFPVVWRRKRCKRTCCKQLHKRQLIMVLGNA